MNAQYLALASRIAQELAELDRIVQRVQRLWEKAARSNDDAYIDATALNLHSFYAGVERIFEWIATDVDNVLPSDRHWHQTLLKQMSAEMPGVRPPVISSQLRQELDRYRGFRHVVRHAYTYNLDPVQVGALAQDLPSLSQALAFELQVFLVFLDDTGTP